MNEKSHREEEPKKQLTYEEAQQEVLAYLDHLFAMNGGFPDQEKPENNDNSLLTIWTAREEAKKDNWVPAIEHLGTLYDHHYSESSRDPSTDHPESNWKVADSAHEADIIGNWLEVLGSE